MKPNALPDPTRSSARPGRPGFRLERLEVLNWGTFHREVWALEARGENALLTGDIGSGKSTLVDAITTLLVQPQRVAYNKAADAEKVERSLRTYVLGHYKKERAEDGPARPVALRSTDSYSVVLGRFVDSAQGRCVTLAQVFWWKAAGAAGQPERFYLVSERALSIKEHFAEFGPDIQVLRKRLGKLGVVHDGYPKYMESFRKKFGIESAQALELFHQTVSMKSVGNLTDFVRQHMLERSTEVDDRIKALTTHFGDLSKAHDAVLTAKTKIALLTPIVEDSQRAEALAAAVERLRACRDSLRPWFAALKGELLEKRLASLHQELERLDAKILTLAEEVRAAQADRDEVKEAIGANGGDRLERLKRDLQQKRTERDARRSAAERYEKLATAVGLTPPSAEEGFLDNRGALALEATRCDDAERELGNEHMELEVAFRQVVEKHKALGSEIASLKQRRSNIPAFMTDLRQRMCTELRLGEAELPFAGELIRVRAEEQAWEGAAERVLRNFGLSLIVSEALYAAVSTWVDRTHLRGKLSYFKVKIGQQPTRLHRPASRSLGEKLAVNPDSEFYSWLEQEVQRRADYTCCESVEELRRLHQGVTRDGQIKTGGERHEKDDRRRIDDRTNYILGWSNEAKIAALEDEGRQLEAEGKTLARQIGAIQGRQTALRARRDAVRDLSRFERFAELDWKLVDHEVERLDRERVQLESESDVLHSLQERLREIEALLGRKDRERDAQQKARGSTENKVAHAEEMRGVAAESAQKATSDQRALFPALQALRDESGGDQQLTVEACDNRESELRTSLQTRIDGEEKRMSRLVQTIVARMQEYKAAFPTDTHEVDASMSSAGEFGEMLEQLRADDLPRYERRFKEQLNENTINEVANFQSQLRRESDTIRDRIKLINRSLRAIDYNPGRYIMLEAVPETDREVKEFKEDLRACTVSGLTGSDDEAYSEAKFLQVKRIIERLGADRVGTTEIDRKWARKVTDVRNWFTFAASEKYRHDDSDHEHYADSGGKSGGQKEKLAYTVLAASLVYQFGLEGAMDPGTTRSFRFVVIDEAFGRGSDESAQYGLDLFRRLDLQLLIVTPLQKIRIIEPFVESVTFVHNDGGQCSRVRNMTIEEYRAEQHAHDEARG